MAFGFNQPIVVDTDGVIIVGHGRYAAAQEIGMKEVPCITVDLTEEEAKKEVSKAQQRKHSDERTKCWQKTMKNNCDGENFL